MALISPSQIVRLSPDFEPDAWYEVRPIRAGDFEHLKTDGHQITLSIDLLASLISAWSYDEPITRETVAMLDIGTFGWLTTELTGLSGIRPDEEKKDSNLSLVSST